MLRLREPIRAMSTVNVEADVHVSLVCGERSKLRLFTAADRRSQQNPPIQFVHSPFIYSAIEIVVSVAHTSYY